MKKLSSERVRPRRRDLVNGWLGKNRPAIQLVGLLALAAGIFYITYTWFPLTENESFLREFVIALLGAVITVVAAVAAAAVPLAQLLRERRQGRAQLAFDSETWTRSAIQVGRMRIPDVVVVASGDRGREFTDGVNVTFTDFAEPRPVPPETEWLREHELPGLRRHNESRGVPFVDEPCVDLVAASVRLEVDGQGRRRQRYELTPAVATYFDFSITTADLDKSFPLPGDGERSLRKAWGVNPTAIEHVSTLPGMAKIGVGTVVVTEDNRLVLGVRGKTFVAGSQDRADARASVHVVAEGMIPTDTDRRGHIDPAVTARRGLREELNLGEREHTYGRVEELHAVGFFFDQLRWQPCFAYLSRIDLTWDELQTLAPTAASFWEVERLASLPFSIRDPEVRLLLLGEHPHLVLASNHAAAALWFALLHQHGLFTMREELTAKVLASALSM